MTIDEAKQLLKTCDIGIVQGDMAQIFNPGSKLSLNTIRAWVTVDNGTASKKQCEAIVEAIKILRDSK